jgi:hypothetical protein
MLNGPGTVRIFYGAKYFYILIIKINELEKRVKENGNFKK